MIAAPRPPHTAPPSWHAGFLALLPAIRAYVRHAFRYFPPEAREDAVQEALANALVAYARLVELGKADLAYASPLARHAVAHIRVGRQVGNRLNGRDVLSPYAQRQQKLTVERLDRYDEQTQAWQEVLIEDKRSTPAEIAASRIDFAAWLRTLSRRVRSIACVLARGETTRDTAQRFGVTAARISQLRRELAESWNHFQGQLHEPESECS
jgi:hypothetical protein